MVYRVVIAETCLEEIEEICEYIKNKLKAEEASNRLRQKIRSVIRELKDSPLSHTKIGKRDRSNREYRRIVIDNYVMLYSIIEEDNVILVSHMYYGGRNYLEDLP